MYGMNELCLKNEWMIEKTNSIRITDFWWWWRDDERMCDEMRHLFPQYEHFTELINEKRSNYDYTERGKDV